MGRNSGCKPCFVHRLLTYCVRTWKSFLLYRTSFSPETVDLFRVKLKIWTLNGWHSGIHRIGGTQRYISKYFTIVVINRGIWIISILVKHLQFRDMFSFFVVREWHKNDIRYVKVTRVNRGVIFTLLIIVRLKCFFVFLSVSPFPWPGRLPSGSERESKEGEVQDTRNTCSHLVWDGPRDVLSRVTRLYYSGRRVDVNPHRYPDC